MSQEPTFLTSAQPVLLKSFVQSAGSGGGEGEELIYRVVYPLAPSRSRVSFVGSKALYYLEDTRKKNTKVSFCEVCKLARLEECVAKGSLGFREGSEAYASLSRCC